MSAAWTIFTWPSGWLGGSCGRFNALGIQVRVIERPATRTVLELAVQRARFATADAASSPSATSSSHREPRNSASANDRDAEDSPSWP